MVAIPDPQHTPVPLEELAFLYGIASDSAAVEQEPEVVRAYATVRRALLATQVTPERREAIEDAIRDYGSECEDAAHSFRAARPDLNGAVTAVITAAGGCATCSPPRRETVGMACQTCGTDYTGGVA